jgi:tellurite resistance protein TerC
MAGAYGFRCLCLLFAAYILHNRWLKLAGAVYLIYLMCKEITAEEEAEEDAELASDLTGAPVQPQVERTFFSVVSGILILDASLSVDNVVAAVAMTPKLWVVYLGVGIGILTLRFVAGFAMRMIARFPILEETAFLLVGFVGALLIFEMEFEFHLGPAGKFAAIVVIVTTCLAYERFPILRTLTRPVVKVMHPAMRAIAYAVGILLWPIAKAGKGVVATVRPRPEPSKG